VFVGQGCCSASGLRSDRGWGLILLLARGRRLCEDGGAGRWVPVERRGRGGDARQWLS
jgi:hypothetical protein